MVTLIGATTENPYFDVIPALVSRSRIFQLQPLTEEHLNKIVDRAISNPDYGYGKLSIKLDDAARNHLIGMCGGDARNLLNALELAIETTTPDKTQTTHITLEVAQESIQKRAVLYDKSGDVHYDTISAFIKSVRGSDPDAALYWLAKMMSAGEDPRFILRRLIILAGEDVGLADPQALVVATSAANAYEYVGLPEAIFPIVEATLYLSTAPKSNSVMAYFDILKKMEEEGMGQVPIHLMDSNRDAKGFGHGAGYQYPHSYEGHFTPQQYLPDHLLGTQFYHPSDQGYESSVQERVKNWRDQQSEGLKKMKSESKNQPTKKEN